jgi:hypothetical protein
MGLGSAGHRVLNGGAMAGTVTRGAQGAECGPAASAGRASSRCGGSAGERVRCELSPRTALPIH